MVTARPYQVEAIAKIKQDWAAGHTDVLLTMATGGGKSFVFLSLLNDLLLDSGKRGLIFCHRKELIDQPLARLYSYYPAWATMDGVGRPRAGVVMAEQNQPQAQLVIATVQSLNAPSKAPLSKDKTRLDDVLYYGPVDYLVTDECFPAGTLVDGRPIETIRVGDTVTAWDEKTCQMTAGIVARTFEHRLLGGLVKITAGSRQIVCTFDHPILTGAGWVCAGDLITEDCIYVSNFDLSLVQESFRDGIEVEKRSDVQGWSNLLLERVQPGVLQQSVLGDHGKNQPEICQRANEAKQSDVQAGKPGEDAGHDHSAFERRFLGGETGKRLAHQTAANAFGSPRLADGSDSSHWIQRAGGPRVPVSLQIGYRQSRFENRYRGGRAESQPEKEKSGGCQENRTLEIARVDRVEVLERGGDGEFERVCPDGHVYNLEVASYHTYTANGIVVHNCHHSVSDSYLALYAKLRAANPSMKHLGVTATPVRADGDGLAKVFQKESAHYGIVELIKAGWLAPVRWLAIQTRVSLAGVASRAGDYVAKQLANVYEVDNCFDLVVESHKKYADGRQAIAFTVSVEGAYRLAEKFERAGIPAGAADGTTNKKERAGILADFQAGRSQVLCNVGLYTEGLDVPQASCIHQVRPTKSDGLYIQMVGRSLRTYPGKVDALILDYAPLEIRNIAMMGDVLGCPLRKDSYVEEEAERGDVQAAFTFDGEFGWREGSPAEIIARQLDYLDQSPWSWYRRDGFLSLGLGETQENGNGAYIERVLVITPPDQDGELSLFGVWRKFVYSDDKRREIIQNWRSQRIASGDFDSLSLKAEELCNKHGNSALAAKQRSWRKEPATDGQIQFARRLPGAFVPGMNKGEMAQSITHVLALRAIASPQIGAVQ